MAPKARIIVFYINEVLIYDDMEFNFDTFNNEVNMFMFSVTLDAMKYHTGQDFYADVKTAKDSYIALWATDQTSALLDRTGHDLTEKDVLNDLALYECTHQSEYDPLNVRKEMLYRYDFGYVPEILQLLVMGLFMRTTAEFDNAYPGNEMNGVGEHCPLVENIQKPMYTRTELPKAWFWKNNVMNSKQHKLSFSDSVPDDITSWTVSGFALSPTLGLGIIKQPLTLVVKKPLFYIVLNLPHSIKRNAVTTIQVTIYNILENALSTEVTLFNKNNEIEFVGQSFNDTTRQTKTVLVPKSNGHPIFFMIIARRLGEIAIKVEAINLLASDTVERMLQVTPESRRYENNEDRFFDLQQHGQKSFSIYIGIPRDIDEGSVMINFALIAKLCDTPISNLESLIHLPTGNGEQNIAKFASNIVILDYLSESGNPSEEVRKKAIDYLQSGYQNQLKYKRSDSSFSIWGGNDSIGSTFLTAFVAKSFKIAAQYIEVNKTIVEDAFNWLASIQTEEGRFNEVGRVINAELQGGLRSTNYALTAYVLIAFLENKDIATTHQQIVNKTIAFLETNLYKMTDEYDLALATYALLLGGRPKSEHFLKKLLETSIFYRQHTERYWQRPPVEVEIAGYALLSYTAMRKYLDGFPIMRWLVRNRSALGGFRGTQDTFVGLKALAKFSAATGRNDYRAIVTHKPNARYTFNIDKENSMVVLNQPIPNDIRRLNVEITGIGIGFFLVASEYYQNINVSKQSFNLNVTVLDTTTIHVQHLKICVSYIPNEAYTHSSMALVEVFFPSGMVVDTEGVKDLSKKIMKTELRFAATSVVVYYDNLGPEANCFIVTSYRKYKVALHRPAYVVVYDYYDQDSFAIESYEGKVMQLCDICEDEDCNTLSC
ncbi:thioester-containing protein 1 allele R1-like [Sabethes cyaneus]|uniref:thioester-containing protein 1 allele R1-like n=1 Tax=Sabethes cyaneus TaxID=53552 RepID=UPI00237DE4E9|nr:thioester-containing protein 1 allele R1-like [Sabethes cyaneus]